jgi:lantibiotic modifying enzyme
MSSFEPHDSSHAAHDSSHAAHDSSHAAHDSSHAAHDALRISRRRFLGSTALTAAAAPVLATWNIPGARADVPFNAAPGASTDFLQSAISTARWIQNAQRQDAHGVYWLPEPDHPEKLSTVSAPTAIYSGSAGTVLFFLQLARVTGDASHLESAARGADYLAGSWRETAEKPGEGVLSGPGLNLALYGGVTGTAFVLNETAKATGNDKYRRAAEEATDYVVRAAKPAGAGLEWSGAPGVAADGSIVLYLLYAADEFGEHRHLVTARKAADRILERAVSEPNGGLSWRGFPAFPGLPKDAYFPNFEGGTAGVAYVLARVSRATHDARYLDAARRGAAHLQSIATVHGDAALIPYRFPDLTDVYYLGFCHGPAGTARTFYELQRLTQDPAYQQWTERLAQGVLQSGIPELQTPGYWNVVCQCCGSAAVIELFVGLWAASGRPEYLSFAQRVARQLVTRGSDLDGKGTRWYQAWTRVRPWEVSAETGYSIGAAGVGTALLHVHLASIGKYRAILLPDNPFPSLRET